MTKKSKEREDKPKVEEPPLESKKPIWKNSTYLSWAIFLFTLSIVLVNLVSVVFPALIISGNSTIAELKDLGIVLFEVDPFVTGTWAGPLFAANLIIFVLGILYFKKKLPDSISKSIHFVFRLDVSKKIAFITIAVLLIVYIAFSASELFVEEEWEDYAGIKQRIENWSPEQVTKNIEPHVRYFLLWSSHILFGYYTIIPFLASISLLVLTYFFTYEITKNRFAGLVAFVLLLQSNLFLTYDSTVSYTNFWILFYLLSLYLVYKVWPLSPLAYLLSIPSKTLTVMFLPMSLFFFFRSKISRKKKIFVSASCVAIILIGASLAASGANLSVVTGTQEEFDSDEFWLGFTSFSYQLRFDGIVLLFILPLVVSLFIASKNGVNHADSIMILISGILLTAPLLTGFTDQTSQPYRFVPIVVFFAIGVGVLLSRRKN